MTWFTLDRHRLDRIVEFSVISSEAKGKSSSEQFGSLMGSSAAELAALALNFVHLTLKSGNVASYETMGEFLPFFNKIWIHSKDAQVKKAVVACISVVRRSLGDSLFFQLLPLLTVSHRRLLDAYMSFDSAI